MNLSPDDPRLTTFALGEITDSVEAEQIVAAVASSSELQEAVEAIRATANSLESAFASEVTPGLSEAERATLHSVAGAVKVDPAPAGRKMIFWPMLAGLAAVVMIGFILAPPLTSIRENASRSTLAGEDSQQRPSKMAMVDENVLATQRPELKAQADAAREEAPTVEAPVADSTPPSSRPAAPARPQSPPAVVAGDYVSIGEPLQQELRMRGKQPARVSFEDSRSLRLSELLVPESGSYAYWVPPPIVGSSHPWNVDAYDPIEETGFCSPTVAPVSTFSIDVDTASYAHVRGILTQGRMPPPSAVRIEEFVNYFPYEDVPAVKSLAEGGDPFAVHLEQAVAPWAPEHRLLRVSLKGYEVPWEERPASNLVFLIDVSGSMAGPNRLPLVKEALQLLVDRLDGRDRVAIVVYAGSTSVALPSTTANNTETIRHAIEQLVAGGSTNANDGIQRAYATARTHLIKGGNNRVILCTDGDFNVGITDRGQLGQFVQEQADDGVSLTVVGFGMGNYKDNMLEVLSTKGKGVYGYIDTSAEARKFFLQQLASNLFTIAHDVKIQVEFNPATVHSYRLIGYDNRRLRAEDFNDDTKRAGDIGPGHSVTAFYEVVPPGVAMPLPGVDALRYQAGLTTAAEPKTEGGEGELATVKLRYKRPGEETSRLIVNHVSGGELVLFEAASTDLRFGAAVAAFGMRLSGSDYVNEFAWEAIRGIALNALGQDPGGHRAEFSSLVERAAKLAAQD